MQHLSSQVLTSLIFASFDLLTDLAVPYVVVASGTLKRALMRCLSSWKVRHQHSNETPDTVTGEDTHNTEETITDKQPPAKLLSRLSTTVMSFYTGSSRTGASTLFSRQSLRSLSSFLDVPTRVVQFKLHPIFLRRLSDVREEHVSFLYTFKSHVSPIFWLISVDG
ncbi:unnamed protein product [Vitrella brassicaformis CCMP3155]|uniref:Uncharacterized protein n=1 Tax=Vitrella brassicaformis (strain CCMP3155) TaxID=1169540 RepID=A0A0G4GKA9_VITBC|nr:unnamed protein product [Vitrella brassicaformis CCMP3155]|eukprot:CEM30427.1 unnamed protein product [Vitrella brassicaformis CCMP3155]